MRFICFGFCLLCAKLESVEYCLWGKQHYDAVHFSWNLKKGMLYCWHLQRKPNNKKGSECLIVNLRTVQKIQKELNEFRDDYESTAAPKSHSDHSDEKWTPKFVGEIQAMIDNDPSESIRSIAKNTEMSEFLIRQRVHEDIQ